MCGVTTYFTALANISNSSFIASGATTVVNLPAVTSYSDSLSTEDLDATTGAQLSLPNLTSLTTTGNQLLRVQAVTGGHVTFAALTSITSSRISLISTGNLSQIDVSALTNFQSTPGFNASTIQLASGGTLLDGNNPNTVINDVNLSTDATFTIQSNQTFSSDNATTTVTGGTLAVQGSLLASLYATLTINGNV